MTAEDLPRRDRSPSHCLSPVGAVLGDLDLADHQLEHPVEDLLFVGDVLVERHRLDTKLGSKTAHGEGAESLPVGQVDCAPKHPLFG